MTKNQLYTGISLLALLVSMTGCGSKITEESVENKPEAGVVETVSNDVTSGEGLDDEIESSEPASNSQEIELFNIELFNPFEHITITYHGIAPHATAIVTADYSCPEMNYITLTCEDEDLDNGDEIVITAVIEGTEADFVKKFGCTLETMQKSYICEGITRYAATRDEISEEAMSQMISQGEDVFKAYVGKRWSSAAKLNSVSYGGYYFMKDKPQSNVDAGNKLCLVYNINATYDGSAEMDTFYFVIFSDILVNADGTCMVKLAEYEAPTADFVGAKHIYRTPNSKIYSGYVDMDALEQGVIFEYLADYNVESSYWQ